MSADINAGSERGDGKEVAESVLLVQLQLDSRTDIRREILVEMLREVLGESLSKLPRVEAGYLEKSYVQGYVKASSAMGMVVAKRRYQKLFPGVPVWLDYLPTRLSRRCMDIAEYCNCPLPELVIDLFTLQGGVHGRCCERI